MLKNFDFSARAYTEEEKEAMLLEPLVREGDVRDFKVWVTTDEERDAVIAAAEDVGLIITEAARTIAPPCGLGVQEAGQVFWCDSLGYASCPLPGSTPEEALRRLRAFPRAETPDDPVEHPKHYTTGKIECIEYIEDKELGFHLGNAVKYITRAGKKDPAKTIEDLEKAVWYLQRKIELLKKEGKA